MLDGFEFFKVSMNLMNHPVVPVMILAWTQRKPTAANLGVVSDSGFRHDKQVNSVVKSSNFQLRLLSKVISFLFNI